MGLFGFGKEKAPEVKVPTAAELQQQQLNFLSGKFPEFTQARESGLAALQQQGFDPQINIPTIGAGQFGPTSITGQQLAPVDFASFQPTSFEQGVAQSSFGPLLEQAQRQALQIGSLSGIPSAAPAHFGRAISPALLNIGQFLAQQGQQRGQFEQQRRFQEAGFGQQAGITNLQAVLQQQQLAQQVAQQQALSSEQARQFNLASAIGQDPTANLLSGASLGAQQSQRQSAADLANFQARQAQQGGGSALLSLLGGAAGFAFGGPAGASLGAGLGGGLGEIFGGGASPSSFGDVGLTQGLGSIFGGGGGGFGGGGGGAGGSLFPQGEALFGGGGRLSDLLGRTAPIGGF